MNETETDADGALWPPAAIRPSTEAVEEYRGLWHTRHLLADLDRHRRERPDQTAVVGYHGNGPSETLSWARYAEEVERFACALRASASDRARSSASRCRTGGRPARSSWP